MRNLGGTLPDGTAALYLLVRDVKTDRVIRELRSHAPHARLLHTSLRHINEAKLGQALD